MKIDRLMSITVYLLKHGKTSAAKLAEQFEVNTRTIMRDIDSLCKAGIPIVSICGVNGGYEILDTYVIDKQLVNGQDYRYIVNALKTMASAYENKTIQETIDKIELLMKDKKSAIEMDMSVVQENANTNEIIRTLEKAIESQKIVEFLYTNNENIMYTVQVEPVGVVYKWYNWYLIAYRVEKADYRMYKLVRMEKLLITGKNTSKEHSLEQAMEQKENNQKNTKIIIEGKACVKAKCREYLNIEIIEEMENGDFVFCLQVPEKETFWYGVLLSFGNNVKVIEPQNIVNKIKKSCREILEVYENEHVYITTD